MSAGYGDRLARGNSKASFTTGAGVSQKRWNEIFSPDETPAVKPPADTFCNYGEDVIERLVATRQYCGLPNGHQGEHDLSRTTP